MSKTVTMIDTVVLAIQGGGIRSLQGAHIPKWGLYSKKGSYSKSVKTLNRKQKEDDIYRPRIAGIRRGESRTLRIEFSAPKLLYGNNIDEVCHKNFTAIVEILRERLVEQGIAVSKETIRRAKVVSFHPSKNIILSGGYTVSSVLMELQKVNLTQKMQLTKQTFYNGGESLQYWSKSHSLAMYDKKKEYCKPKRKHKTDQDPRTVSFYEDLHLLPEILKIEVRLSQKRKLNEVMQKVGVQEDLTFEGIFKKDVSKKILCLYWKTLIADGNSFLFNSPSGPQALLARIMRNRTEMKQKEAIYLVGLLQSAKDDGGVMGLRKTLGIGNRAWYRLAEGFETLNFKKDAYPEWIADIENQLFTFEPIRLSKLRVKYCKV